MADVGQILKQYWGFNAFRPMQREIIESVLAGHDTLALLPTGGGKSVCFQVPALAGNGLCLVVSPLIALMKDQVANLRKKGIKAVAVYSGLTARETGIALDSCVYGNCKFLYLSPERLATDEFRMRLTQMKVNLLAVDEAHCISQWGYDFRPPYLKIAEVREWLKGVPVMALTATATPKVITDIQDKLHFKNGKVYSTSFARPNLSYVVRLTPNKEEQLLQILKKVPGSAVVYVRNRRKTREIADYLNRHKISSSFYHAGLEPNVRSQRQEQWVSGKVRVICCTNAFGMGIDKPDVRAVVHMDIPDSPEAYFQEAGRAGRDGHKAYAALLVEKQDITELEEKVETGFPPVADIKQIYDALGNYCRVAYNDGAGQSFDLDTPAFAKSNGLDTLKVMNALRLLQQQNLIAVSEGLYRSSQVHVTAGRETLYKFQVEHKAFDALLKFILRTSEGVFEDFVNIDEGAAAARLKVTEEEVIKQLHRLDEYEILHYHPRKNKPQVIFPEGRKRPADLRLNPAFIAERKADYALRIAAMVNYARNTHTCRTVQLLAYFGETGAADCGICDVCLQRKKVSPSTGTLVQNIGLLENELKKGPLNIPALHHRLNMDTEALTAAVEYLLDNGKITRTTEGALAWVQ